jgi:hypothetical protein
MILLMLFDRFAEFAGLALLSRRKNRDADLFVRIGEIIFPDGISVKSVLDG